MILQGTQERLEEALRQLALDAAELFDELLREGAELPFEIEAADARSPLPMYQYAPLTDRFIRDHAVELRRFESFVEVREMAGDEAAVGFLVGLWEGRSEFELSEDRLRGAIDAVLATLPSAGNSPAGEVIVPLIGFHMPADEVELDGVRIVRATEVSDAPVEAIDATRSGREGRPGFLACVRCGTTPVAPAAAVADDLRRALRTIRLFRPGAVGLSAYGWARHAGGWERFGTGASPARHGGYRLTGPEVEELEKLSRTLTERGARLPALAWATSRFDLGAERASQIEALSDYLLALRGLLEGGGPARAAVAARAAALVAGPDDREPDRVCVERALVLERKLMSGGRYRPSAGASPLVVIAGLEDLLRRILKGMATGELGGDLRVTADEILLADGLRVGEAASAAQSGETAEWRLPDLEADADPDAEIEIVDAREEGEVVPIVPEAARAAEAPSIGSAPDQSRNDDLPEQQTTRIIQPDGEVRQPMRPDPFQQEPEGGERSDWFEAGDGELEWPAFAASRRDRGERSRSTDRAQHLFPTPDATDWDVGELRYQRRKRSRA